MDSAKNFLIYCVDPRYGQFTHEDVGLPNGYNFTCLGGSLFFAENEVARHITMLQMDVLQKAIGEPDAIIFVDHWDSKHEGHGCKYALVTGGDTRERHEQSLRKAARKLADYPEFKGVPVKLLLHDIDARKVEEVSVQEPALKEVAV